MSSEDYLNNAHALNFEKDVEDCRKLNVAEKKRTMILIFIRMMMMMSTDFCCHRTLPLT